MHECDVTLLDVRFVVILVHPSFASSEMYPFVGCMGGENVLYVTVSNVVLVSHLRIRQNIF